MENRGHNEGLACVDSQPSDGLFTALSTLNTLYERSGEEILK